MGRETKLVTVDIPLLELVGAALEAYEEWAGDGLLHGVTTEDGVCDQIDERRFRVVYRPPDRDERWEIVLDEEGMQDVADESVTRIEAIVEPERREDRRPRTRGEKMLDALLGARLLALHAHVQPSRFASLLEGVVLDAVDRGGDSAQAVLDALVELEAIDDVFGDAAEVFGAIEPHLGR